jgi:rhodanese/phosphatase family protein
MLRSGALHLKTSRRLAAASLALLLSGCAYFAKHTAQGACRNDLGAPIRNFCAETPTLWRGERPNRSDASWLLGHGVGTVVNVEVFLSDRSAFDHAEPPSGSLEVQYFHVPDFEPVHLINWSLLDDHVAHFIAIVERAPKPIYVHCLDGLDRTGVLIAAYRVLMEGVDPEVAISDIARYGTPWVRVDARYIRSLQGERRAEILRKITAWESHLEPNARIGCNAGMCHYTRLWVLRFNDSSRQPPGT